MPSAHKKQTNIYDFFIQICDYLWIEPTDRIMASKDKALLNHHLNIQNLTTMINPSTISLSTIMKTLSQEKFFDQKEIETYKAGIKMVLEQYIVYMNYTSLRHSIPADPEVSNFETFRVIDAMNYLKPEHQKRLLLEADMTGKSALMHAVKNARHRIVALLLESMSRLDIGKELLQQVTKQDNNVLMLALIAKDRVSVDLILDAVALLAPEDQKLILFGQNRQKQTVLELATSKFGKTDIDSPYNRILKMMCTACTVRHASPTLTSSRYPQFYSEPSKVRPRTESPENEKPDQVMPASPKSYAMITRSSAPR